MEGYTLIKRIAREEVESLMIHAKEDNHMIVAPAYRVERGGHTIGSISVIPAVEVWLDSKRAKVRDTLAVGNFVENLLVDRGAPVLMLPCTDESPLSQILAPLGFIDGGITRIHYKFIQG